MLIAALCIVGIGAVVLCCALCAVAGMADDQSDEFLRLLQQDDVAREKMLPGNTGSDGAMIVRPRLIISTV
jgi:hypothetical protein